MTDKQWQKTIDKSVKLLRESFEYRKMAEDEYVRRYGHHPSEVDDDWWIDTLHYGQGSTDLYKIKESAEMRVR